MNHPVWIALAWQDIKLRYRGSILGPLWITISMAIMITIMGVIYGNLLNIEERDYIPFFSIGLIIWTLVSTTINEATITFTQNESLIKQIKIPPIIYIYRNVFRNIIIFIHNIVIIIGVVLIFDLEITLESLIQFFFGFLIVILNLVNFSKIVSFLATKYRDIQQIIHNIMQITFFSSPIIWYPEIIINRGSYEWILTINPIYYFLKITRDVLMGGEISMNQWIIVSVITIVNFIMGLIVYSWGKNKMIYWL